MLKFPGSFLAFKFRSHIIIAAPSSKVGEFWSVAILHLKLSKPLLCVVFSDCKGYPLQKHTWFYFIFNYWAIPKESLEMGVARILC